MRIEDEEEEIEEEELVSIIHPSSISRHRLGSDIEQDELEMQSAGVSNIHRSSCLDTSPIAPDHQADGYYLEPLMPAVPKIAKEKTISLNKEEESGESGRRALVAARKAVVNVPSSSERKAECLRPPTEGSLGISPSGNKTSQGFYLHLSGEQDSHSPFTAAAEVGHNSDSDIADLEEDDEEDDQLELLREVVKRGKGKCLEEGLAYECGDGESVKLREDLKLSERDDKEDHSGCSSPCHSTASWASSCSASGSASVRMTSFAERKLLKLGLRDGFSSTSSSQKTTPDGSDLTPCPPWQLRCDRSSGWQTKEPGPVLGKNMAVNPSVVPSELLQLHMQLEEQRRAIEYQKKKMEALSARQRLKLGKAAFLNIVKKGGGRSDTLPLPLKHSSSTELTAADRNKAKIQSSRDDSFLDSLKVEAKAGQEREQINRDNRLSIPGQDNVTEPDLNECSRSIDLLNEAISSIQQQMMQLSIQQGLLMKQSVVSPPESVQSAPDTTIDTTQTASTTSDSKAFAVHFVDISDSNCAPARRPPKLSSSQRSKVSERKQNKEKKSNSQAPDCTSSGESPDASQEARATVDSSKLERSVQRSTTFRVHESPGEGTGHLSEKVQTQDPPFISTTSVSAQESTTDILGKDLLGGEESTRVKGQLIEVDLSELKDPEEDVPVCAAEGEQKNVLGFFFKVQS